MSDQADALDAKIDQIGDLVAAAKVTKVTIVLDRSGSMWSIRDDVVVGLNAFIADQQTEPGECRLTLWLFDGVATEVVIADVPIAEVQPLTENDFVPRGGTPLYDALARVISEAEICHQDGEHEVIVIFTDGKENDSKEYTKEQISVRIKERTEAGWVFSYVGANHDSYEASAAIGISRGSTQNFAASALGAARSMQSLSRAAKQYRGATRKLGDSAVTYASTDFFGGVKEAEDEPT